MMDDAYSLGFTVCNRGYFFVVIHTQFNSIQKYLVFEVNLSLIRLKSLEYYCTCSTIESTVQISHRYHTQAGGQLLLYS
jgi:hypothetical protein